MTSFNTGWPLSLLLLFLQSWETQLQSAGELDPSPHHGRKGAATFSIHCEPGLPGGVGTLVDGWVCLWGGRALEHRLDSGFIPPTSSLGRALFPQL